MRLYDPHKGFVYSFALTHNSLLALLPDDSALAFNPVCSKIYAIEGAFMREISCGQYATILSSGSGIFRDFSASDVDIHAMYPYQTVMTLIAYRDNMESFEFLEQYNLIDGDIFDFDMLIRDAEYLFSCEETFFVFSRFLTKLQGNASRSSSSSSSPSPLRSKDHARESRKGRCIIS